MRRAAVAILVFVGAIGPALAVGAQTEITPDDIAAARERRSAVSAELESVTREYDVAVSRLVELENSLTMLGIELAEKEQELAVARVAARAVATERYMYAGASTSVLFDAVSIEEVPVRVGYLDILSREGTDTVIRLFALEESYQAQQTTIEQALADQVGTKAELEELAASILTRLEDANAEYEAVVNAYEIQEEERRQREEEERRQREEEERRRQEEEERRRREATTTTTSIAVVVTTTTIEGTATSSVPSDEGTTTTVEPGDTTTTIAEPGDTTTSTEPPPTTTTNPPTTLPPQSMVCPVDGAVAFTDTWGASRSGGRTHKGVDMIAARGTPTVAIEAGTVKRMHNGGLGGITVTLTGVSGDEYYYAHLDGWASGLTVGQSLAVGELLGYVGSTGNAQYSLPHLHFEHHPGGGSAVNPYPLVAGLCF